MDRIGHGVAKLDAPAGVTAASAQTIDDLRKSVEEARRAKATLEARMSELSQEADRLRKANEDLRDTIQALRQVGEAKLGDPARIDAAMAAELESLRAAQAVSEAEVRAILEALTQLLHEKKETA